MGGAIIQKKRSGPINLYEPCQECKKKRTLCIRVERPYMNTSGASLTGHANLSTHEPLEGGGEAVHTYGNWPSADNPDPRSPTTAMRDFKGDDFSNTEHWNPKEVRCKEIDEKQEQKLKEALNKPATWGAYPGGQWCSNWSAGIYNDVTGSNLGGFTPSGLGNQLNPPFPDGHRAPGLGGR
jgi:hypothetical protein